MRPARAAAMASVTAAVMLIGAGSHALAQTAPPVSDPSGMMSSFNATELEAVLESAGYQVAVLNDGRARVLGVENAAGQFIYLRPRVCLATDSGGARCVGLQTFVLFDAQATAQSIAAFNARYPFASAGAERAGGYYLSRYDIADYGMPRGNLAIIVANFFHLAEIFQETVTFDTKTASADGYADDLKARRLNAAALTTVSDRIAARAVPSHRVGYELEGGELPQLVDGAAPYKDKISN